MKLTEDDLQHTLKLAHLVVKPGKEAMYLNQMQDVLTYMEGLNDLPLDDVEPSAYAQLQTQKMRADEPVDFGDLLLEQNAPDWDNGSFKVPQMKADPS